LENKEVDIRALAERIYNLDEEVYKQLGSSLGRVFNGSREQSIEEVVELLKMRKRGYKVRSELALISNMARTIPDKAVRKQIMREYDEIFKQTISLPTSFGGGDILDKDMAALNKMNLTERFAENDHLIICIGRTYGCGGSEIGFTLADKLRINYYDVEIFDTVLKRLEAEKDAVEDTAGQPYGTRGNTKLKQDYSTVREKLRQFSRYHGLSKADAVFFNQSDLLCDMAKKEDFIVMGRCADAILTNNNIPHISIFISAPLEQRIRRIMEINPELTEKQARRRIEKADVKHVDYYKYYTGKMWSKVSNYDLCINSASYGIDGSVEMILRMIKREAEQ
jgi:cytidylate kinase